MHTLSFSSSSPLAGNALVASPHRAGAGSSSDAYIFVEILRAAEIAEALAASAMEAITLNILSAPSTHCLSVVCLIDCDSLSLSLCHGLQNSLPLPSRLDIAAVATALVGG